MNQLHLEVLDFEGPACWRWRLITDTGAFLADHQVNLDEGSAEYEAFSDLHRYLRKTAAPDRTLASETERLEWVGRWIGEQVWGSVGPKMLEQRPAVVRLQLPEEPAGAAVLAYRPLELGHVQGKPLGLQRVSLIVEPPGAKQPADGEAGGPLRVLGLFSLPEGTGALNLRRERYQLTRQLDRIATARRPRRAIDLRVVQYGATRDRLSEMVKEAPGWDVLHVSGHGLPGGLVLEDAQGRPDVISSDELVELLEWTAERLKLVVLSSCDSAATTLSEARRLLGLDADPDPADAANGSAGEQPEATSLPAVAHALTQRLGCAVVAMRYPVGDDFAIELSRELYQGLLHNRQPLPGALQQALPAASKNRMPSPGTPPLSVATPALFGPRAADLQLQLPRGEPGEFRDTTSLAHVPKQHAQFVGRVGVMLRAGEALAPESGWSGVLLHGMAGGGKTAIAVELAHGHADQFPDGLVWYKAPDEGADITDALTQFALKLERQLAAQLGEAAAPKLAHLPDRRIPREDLEQFLPLLTEFMQQNKVLVVLDNLESLLTETGAWRDPRWGMTVRALAAHDGLSRVLLTSRTQPEELDARVRVETVHALSLDEALLLAYELPHLGRLLNPVSGADAQHGRELVRRTLRVVQGHPHLLRLADGQAQDPMVLAARLDEADRAWAAGDTRPDRFFGTGESDAEPSEFLRVLDGWTRSAAAGLPEAARLLFEVLCCLEEDDRNSLVAENTWEDIWRRLERPDAPPALEEPLAALATTGLVDIQDIQADLPGQQERIVGYQIHPGVAAPGRTTASQMVADAVDGTLADFWTTVFHTGWTRKTGEASALVVQAGRAVVPYLLRQHRWEAAILLLDEVVRRDPSVGTAAAVLPLLRRLTHATTGTRWELHARSVLVRAWARVEPGAGETELRSLLQVARTLGQHQLALAIASSLIELLGDTGRLEEALSLVDQKAEWTRQAGPGPWTQLADQGQRLQVLRKLGRYEEVLAQVQALRRQMASLPTTPDEHTETIQPWNVREAILQVGAVAAGELGRWEEALALNADVAASKQRRGAHPLEQARARYNDYPLLLALGRIQRARELLHAIRDVAESHHDQVTLALVANALATIEDKLGHHDLAVTLGEDALRLSYATSDPADIASSHHNLASFLHGAADRDPAMMLAHRLAAAVISLHTGQTHMVQMTVQVLAGDIALIQGASPLPSSFVELCERVGQTAGVHLKELIGRLADYPGGADAALTEIQDQACAIPTEELFDIQGALQAWMSEIAAIHAAVTGDQQAARWINQQLTAAMQHPDFAEFVGRLRRILAGERDPERLLSNLRPPEAAIVQRAVDVITGRVELTTEEAESWRPQAVLGEWHPVIKVVMAAARGDTDATEGLEEVLTELARTKGKVSLANVIGHIVAGARGQELLDGLDSTDTLIVTAVLDQLTSDASDDRRPSISPQ